MPRRSPTFLLLLFFLVFFSSGFGNFAAEVSGKEEQEIREDALQLLMRTVGYFQALKDRDDEKERSFLSDDLRKKRDKYSKGPSAMAASAGASVSKIVLNWFAFKSLKISENGDFGVTKVHINFILAGVPRALDQIDRQLWAYDKERGDWLAISWNQEYLYRFDEPVSRDFDAEGIQKFDYVEYSADDFSNYFLKIASDYMDSGDIPKAYEYYEKAIKSDGFGVWDKLPLSEENRLFLDEVLSKLFPEDHIFMIKLGDAFVKKGMLKNAIDTFQRAQKVKKSDVAAYYKLANVYYNLKDYQKAIEEYKKSLDYVIEHPLRLSIFTRIGYSYFILGNYDEAKKYLTLAFLADPLGENRALPYKILGDLYYKEGDFEEAVRAYQTSQRLMRSEKRGGEFGKLDELIEDSLEKGKEWAKLSDRLYKKLLSHKDDEGYLKDLISLNGKISKKEADITTINYRLGELYYLLKNYRKSASYFSKVLKDEPDSLGALIMLRGIGEKSRDSAMLKAYEEKIWAIYPEPSFVEDIPEEPIFIPESIDLSLPMYEEDRSLMIRGDGKEKERRYFFLKAPESGNYLVRINLQRLSLLLPLKARIFMDLYVDNDFLQRFLVEEGPQELFSLAELDTGVHCVVLKFSSDNLSSADGSSVNLLLDGISLVPFDGRVVKSGELELFKPPASIILRSGNLNYENMGDIIINGRNISPERRGYNLAAINPVDGTVFDVDFFDFFEDPKAPENLRNKISSLPKDAIVCLSSQDEASLRMDEKTAKSLEEIGIKDSLYSSKTLKEDTLDKLEGNIISSEDKEYFSRKEGSRLDVWFDL